MNKKTPIIFIVALIIIVAAAWLVMANLKRIGMETAGVPAPVTVVTTTTTSTTTETGRVRGPEDVSVKVGQTSDAAGLSITLNSVTNDSRCPQDVQCIQAGSVTANVTLMSGDNKADMSIVSNASPVTFYGYQVSISGVSPSKFATSTISKNDYTIVFHVVPTAKGDNI